jgi:hypothetical protein
MGGRKKEAPLRAPLHAAECWLWISSPFRPFRPCRSFHHRRRRPWGPSANATLRSRARFAMRKPNFSSSVILERSTLSRASEAWMRAIHLALTLRSAMPNASLGYAKRFAMPPARSAILRSTWRLIWPMTSSFALLVDKSGPSSSGSTWLTTCSSGYRTGSSARTKFAMDDSKGAARIP